MKKKMPELCYHKENVKCPQYGQDAQYGNCTCCKHFGLSHLINPEPIKHELKVYLVWKIDSYCDCDVVKVFDDKNKAEEFIKITKVNIDHYPHYEIEEKIVE